MLVGSERNRRFVGLKVSLAYPLVSDLNPASCVQEVLCTFSEAYGDYLSPICEQPNLITDLLKIADNSIHRSKEKFEQNTTWTSIILITSWG